MPIFGGKRSIEVAGKDLGVEIMRVTSILRAGFLAVALMAPVAVALPALADTASHQPQAQNQDSNSGPYDGADSEAAKRAFY
jgi:hypothetical protein